MLTYSIVDHLPDGLTYVPGSATGGLTLRSDGALTWTGDMLPPEPVQWLMSTSATNPSCDTGFGGYFNLEDSGFFTDAGLTGDEQAWLSFSGNVNTFYGDDYEGIRYTDDGYAYFGDGEGPTRTSPQNIPDAAAPNNVAAGLWADLEIVYDEMANHGLTVVGIPGLVAIVEYDDPVLAGTSTSVGDMQMIL